MQIRFLANSKGKSFTILGFESENERAAFFDCLQKSDAFLGDLRQRLDFSSLVKQLRAGLPSRSPWIASPSLRQSVAKS